MKRSRKWLFYQVFMFECLYHDSLVLLGDVPHKVSFGADIRAYFGTKLFGKCHRYARKTCSESASSQGDNKILVTLSASDFKTFSAGNMDFLQFNLGVKVENMLDASAYAPMKVSKEKECNALPDWLGSFNIDRYVVDGANSFLQSQKNKINELRGPKLLQRMENILKEKFGAQVTLPVKITDRHFECGQSGCPKITIL